MIKPDSFSPAISSAATPLFSNSQESGEFIRLYREGRAYFANILPSALCEILGYLDDVGADVLFDRATRKQSRLALDPFPRGRASMSRSRTGGVQASRLYREEGLGMELSRLLPEVPAFAQFARSFREELCTPVDSITPSLLILPAATEPLEDRAVEDIFLIKLRGVAILGSTAVEAEAQAGVSGALLFVPKGDRFDVLARTEAVLLKLEVVLPSPAALVLRQLERQLPARARSAEAVIGLLGERSRSGAAKALLNQVLGDLQTALEGCNADAIAGEWRPEPPQAAKNAGRSRSTRRAKNADTPGSFLYDDKEWGLKGIKRRSDDIHIVTYKRSGTTWMQMILYQLLTPGDLDAIQHIYEFSPYAGFELKQLGTSARIDNLPSPRVLKTHQTFDAVYAPEGRFIYVAREGLDVAVSGYHHHAEIGNGPIPFDVYFDRFLTERPGWFDHVNAWWANRTRANVLFLTYRELQEDLSSAVRRIADFCAVPLDAAKLARVVERSSFAFMKQHEAKFHHMEAFHWLLGCRDSPGFIRKGGIATGRAAINSSQRQRFNAKYQEKLGPLGIDLDR